MDKKKSNKHGLESHNDIFKKLIVWNTIEKFKCNI